MKIKLWVVNGGAVDGSASATVVGIENGSVVYDETLLVRAAVAGGREEYAFPSYDPTRAGVIMWIATIADDEPDVDEATTKSKVSARDHDDHFDRGSDRDLDRDSDRRD